jgi:hypothetical protein
MRKWVFAQAQPPARIAGYPESLIPKVRTPVRGASSQMTLFQECLERLFEVFGGELPAS